MAVERYLEEAVADNPLSGEGRSSLQKRKSSDDNPSRAFDCNICLDSVQDPVITLCGHLYCWPCIYKWLHLKTISTGNQDPKQQQCPVCKAEVSDSTLIPLYGRGLTAKESRGMTPQLGMAIPRRPLGPICGVATIRLPNTTNNQQFQQQLHHHGHSYHHPQIYYPQQGGYPASPMRSHGGMTIDVPDPVIRMFGEMVYTRVFGNSIMNFYTNPNSYNLAGSTSPRIRRHVMQADKSLGRISFFLLCCIILCLLLF